MSLRQVLKRTLAEESVGASTAAAPTPPSPPAPKRRKPAAGAPVAISAPSADAPAPARAKPKPAAKPAAKTKAVPKAKAAAAVPRIELAGEHEDGGEEEEDEEEEENVNDDEEDDDEAGGAAADHGSGDDEVDDRAGAMKLQPLKKRFLAAAAVEEGEEENDNDEVVDTVTAASSAGGVFGGLNLDEDIPDFFDGWDVECYGDAADRAQLADMTEVQRQEVIAQRFEARQRGQQNVIMRRQLQQAARQKARAAGTWRPRGAAASDDNEDDEDAAVGDRVMGGRKNKKKPLRRVTGRRVAAKSSDEDDDSSSSSSSDQDSSLSSGSSDSSSDSESDASGKGRGRGASSKRETAAARKARLARERERELYGSDEEGGGEAAISAKAIKRNVRARAAAAGGADAAAAATAADLEKEDPFADEDDDDAAVLNAALSGASSGGASAAAAAAANDAAEADVDALRTYALLKKRQVLLALGKPYFHELIKGAYVRVVQPPAAGQPPSAKRYRLARVVGAVHAGPRGVYNPWYHAEALKAQAENPLPSTDLQLHIAFGSSRHAPEAPAATAAAGAAAAPVPRLVQIVFLSDAPPSTAEFVDYRARLATQYARGHNAEDLLPTVGDLRREQARKQALIRASGFSAADVEKSIAANDKFTAQRLRAIANLAYEREQAQIRIERCRARLAEFDAAAPAAVKLRAEIDALQTRLSRIADEESARRERQREKEAEKLRTGRDASVLTRLLNSRAEAHNRAVAEHVAAAERGKSNAELHAETESNPFLRRRTQNALLWNLSGASAPPESAAAAAGSASGAAPASATQPSATAAAADGPAAAPPAHVTVDDLLEGMSGAVDMHVDEGLPPLVAALAPLAAAPTPAPAPALATPAAAAADYDDDDIFAEAPKAPKAALSLADMKKKLGLAA